MKLIVFFTVFVVISAADVQKLTAIEGSAKFLEIDSKGVTYIVTKAKLQNSDNLYVVNSNYDVVFKETYSYVASVLFNHNEEFYLFEYLISTRTIIIWTYDKNVMVRKHEFKPSAYWSWFFDHDGNLFFNSIDGINILRKNEPTPIIISNLDGYRIINNRTNAVDEIGNVYVGVGAGSSDRYDTSVVIPKDEITKPSPIVYQINANVAKLYNMVSFKDSIFCGTGGSLIRFKDDSHYEMIRQPITFLPIFLTPVNDRLYLQYQTRKDSLKPLYDAFQFVTPNYEIVDVTGYSPDLLSFDQTFDGNGNVFFGGTLSSSEGGSAVYYLRNNETACAKLNVPNSIFIFGLAASESGDLWILSQNFYLVPRGTSNAVKVGGFPYVAKSWPMKAKPGTDEVLIGCDDGVYVARG